MKTLLMLNLLAMVSIIGYWAYKLWHRLWRVARHATKGKK